MCEETDKNELLPHHMQQELCTSRLPYRQGRKLTAVKVYSINNESRHLLVFGVPTLNLRQEIKFLFLKFGKLLQFNITKYPSEQFTETYHALYENIQSSRIAKRMLDTTSFYGSPLHIVYAPELETIEETKEKMLLRKTNVVNRLRNLNLETEQILPAQREVTAVTLTDDTSKSIDTREIDEGAVSLTDDTAKSSNEIDNECTREENKTNRKMFMGDENSFKFGKRTCSDYRYVKRVKKSKRNAGDKNVATHNINNDKLNKEKNTNTQDIEIIDITSTSKEIVTNINEGLNYDNFGKELIRKVPYKPVNKIQFNFNKKS